MAIYRLVTMGPDSTAFYSAVAGLLPVLLLTLAFEGQMWGRTTADERTAVRVVVFVLVMVFLACGVVGEALSLHVLLGGRPTEMIRDLTLSTVSFAAVFVLMAVLYRASVELRIPGWMQWIAIAALTVPLWIGLALLSAT